MEENPAVLIVDDEQRMCKGLERLLRRRNYATQTSRTGEEALEKMAGRSYDVYLLDIGLPDIDGIRLMERIVDRWPDAQIIMMTGDASVDTAVMALKRGAVDYLKKPFDPEDLDKTLRNVWKQKQLIESNRSMTERLRFSERRYRYLIQNSPDMIYMLDADGHFTFVNKAVETLFGYEAEYLIGKPYQIIFDDLDVPRAQFRFNERRTGARATSGLELRLKTGPHRQSAAATGVNGHATVELNATGIYRHAMASETFVWIGTYGVVRDVSERKQLQAELLQAKKMQAIGNLAGGIAHDFNNLLMGIQGNASLMLMDLSPDDAFYERIRNIEQHVQNGAALTQQLLGFVKGGNFEIRTVNVNSLIRKQNRMFGRTRKEIVLVESFSADVWPVDVDPVQIEQVLLNLYVNAWHAMPEGGTLEIRTQNIRLGAKEPVIRSAGLHPGRYVQISVADTGKGMDSQTLQRIFEPFFTTKRMGKGSGLGLSLAYGIIQSHGGVIRAYSKPGRGSRFEIYLPASDRVEDSRQVDACCRQGGYESVLLVDDEPLVLNICRDNLKKLGYSVMTAGGGEEAIRCYQKAQPPIDLVVLDMVMPGLNGRETYEALKRMDPHVRVLLTSGYSVEGQAEAILEKGCNGFIQKPFTIEQLSTAVRGILDRSWPPLLPQKAG